MAWGQHDRGCLHGEPRAREEWRGRQNEQSEEQTENSHRLFLYPFCPFPLIALSLSRSRLLLPPFPPFLSPLTRVASHLLRVCLTRDSLTVLQPRQCLDCVRFGFSKVPAAFHAGTAICFT